MRGEDDDPACPWPVEPETPPRAWGRLLQYQGLSASWRNTPTCVGKTSLLDLVKQTAGKHPHVRGEDAYPHNKVSSYLETPPRAWGRPAVLNHAHLEGGNTPTCVGKTVRHADISLRVEKHPHVRGEDFHMSSQGSGTWETPPRAWGRHAVNGAIADGMRNTPTCVGKTMKPLFSSLAKEKHPHVRGEDLGNKPGRELTVETPPRAWGRRWGFRMGGRGKRNTPTCVGKTRFPKWKPFVEQKHPHVRGEDRDGILCPVSP